MTITAARSPFRHEPGLDFAAPEEDERFEEALARVRSQLGRTYPLVIGGTEVDRGETFASLNPARPAEVIGHHAAATLDDVDAAIAAAGEAFADWSQTHAEERAALLFDVADRIVERRRDFAALLTLEVGKIREEADGEIAEVADVLRWYAQQMLDLDRPRPLLPVDGEQTSLVYVPLGVGAIVSPWNFPLSLTTGMMSAALVAGNTVVVKPASASATSAAWLVDLFRECGAPAGVINLLTGSGGLIGDALVDHPQTRFVAFTGSKDVGVRINERAARLQPGQIWIKRVQLELGGKNAILVDETADLERAAEAIVTSAFGYQGQKCSACSRAIVVDAVHDELLLRIVERARRLRLGDPTERDTDFGPLVDESAFHKVVEYVDIGRVESALVFGGGTREGGYYVEPTIFDDVGPGARIAQEEIFGPVLAIVRARDFDHALDVANGTEFGLAGAVFTADRDRIEQARRRFHVGNLYVNRKCTGALTGAHPFGGFNLSGTDSKAGGPDYLLFFLQAKSVAVRAG